MNTDTVLEAPPNGGVEPPPLSRFVETRRQRGLAGLYAVIGVAVFLVAAALDPYDDAGRPRTHGTHRQLGLPACAIKSLTGVGCPSCGMTTTFALLAHGDPVVAWQTNWAGCVVALIAFLGTTWFLAVAAGLPPGRMTAEGVVLAMVTTGAGVALMRWLATVAHGLAELAFPT